MLPQVESFAPVGIHWFSGGGAVVERVGMVEVTIRGVLVAHYRAGEIGPRNAVLVGLAAAPTIHLGQLASAFGITEERLRQIRRRAEREGLAAVVREPERSRTKADAPTWERLAKLFDQGVTVKEAHARVVRSSGLSRSTVGAIRLEWQARRQREAAAHVEAAATADETPQLTLALASPSEEASRRSDSESPATSTTSTSPITSGYVQHVGAWLLQGVAARYGLHDELRTMADAQGLPVEPLRQAADAVIAALAMGEPTVEGVRRLATPSGAQLLRTPRMPSPETVRRTLQQAARVGGQALHESMARRLLARAGRVDGPTVFYVDNHLRPYTGQQVLRRGWRMQEKRVRPGTTDLYVHDEDGRPVFRFPSPTHEGLTTWLPQVAAWLRAALGEDRRILLAFDRGGAFPDVIAKLRSESFELVTYERRPYRELPERDFHNEVTFDDGDGAPEVVRYREQHIALGHGRGDVRRLALRMPDGRQVNLLTISASKAPELIGILRGRWVQENAFKHGVERWGINHLDGRRVTPVDPDAIVPNPARRRLDDALRLVSVRAGLVRNALADLDGPSPKRTRLEAELLECLARRVELLEDRNVTPKKAPLRETELADKLVAHEPLYKTTLDTIRIVCANAEADLASILAGHLKRPREAKKILAALFAAPGRVTVAPTEVRVALEPAASRAEKPAIAALLRDVNALQLALPGDAATRVLRFVPKS